MPNIRLIGAAVKPVKRHEHTDTHTDTDKYNGLSGLDIFFTEATQNDEFETMLKLYILLYVDDTIIMAENQEDLQVALNAVGNYCEQWKLQVNVNKTKIIKFSKRKSKKFPNDQYDFCLNGES